MVKLQAHRGVCTEYPENTMAAYRGAIAQDYPVIELDPAVTADGVFVVLHDRTLNRTARKPDGSAVEDTRKIEEIPYAEAASYEYGSWFSPKFKGEKLPLLAEVLQLAKENGILIKIDNKIWGFPEKYMDSFWELLRSSGASLAMTCNTLETTKKALQEIPDIEIHYDGVVTEENLICLREMTDKLTVWLPFQCPETSWVRIPFVSQELSDLVKKYAKLGIWLVARYKDYDEICRLYSPDYVETPGQIKPIKNVGKIVDTHTHAEYSHDSTCKIVDMAGAQRQKGMYGFAVTDHCDVRSYKRGDIIEHVHASAMDTKSLKAKMQKSGDDSFRLFAGVELGGAVNSVEAAEELIKKYNYDIVVASLHEVTFGLGKITELSDEQLYTCLDKYGDKYLRNLQSCSCDVAAHYFYPLRYINGVNGRNLDYKYCEEKLRTVLQYIIQHGIALEVNTSCMEGEDIDWMYNDWLLELYTEMGGFLVTFASDAHKTENAARMLERALALLKKHGLRNVFYFENRQSIQCTLE